VRKDKEIKQNLNRKSRLAKYLDLHKKQRVDGDRERFRE
jgi:hypothetical protein